MKSGDLCTFTKLFQAYEIEVPILQRDYAQGRVDDKTIKVRGDFLKSIFNSLNDSKKLKLDFVYGTINGKMFIPLDGQQRITTLFLIHWYYGILDDFEGFAYKTRFSSSDFIKKLATINSQDLLKQIPIPKEGSINTLSDAVRDQVWFLSIWEQDPTVAGILTMLDAIHEYKDKPKSVNNLDLIQFYFLELEGFELTDDLYIKMNARGKHLNDYENFKAELLELLYSKQEYLGINIEDKEKLKQCICDLEQRLDNRWLDFVWELTNKDSNHSDSSSATLSNFHKLINNFLGTTWLVNVDKLDENPFTNEGLYKEMLTKIDSINTLVFINKLITTFDSLCDRTIWMEDVKLKYVYINESSVFKLLLSFLHKTGPSYKLRVYLHFVFEYLNNKIDERSFQEYIYFVERLIENSTIEDESTFRNSLLHINSITFKIYKKSIDKHFNFYDLLKDIDFGITSVFNNQLAEERLKAKLRSLSDDWDKAISEAEDHPYFKGRLSFWLYYSANEKDYYSKSTEAFCLVRFNLVKKWLFKIFDNNGLFDSFSSKGEYIFERALIALHALNEGFATGDRLPAYFTILRYKNNKYSLGQNGYQEQSWYYLINKPDGWLIFGALVNKFKDTILTNELSVKDLFQGIIDEALKRQETKRNRYYFLIITSVPLNIFGLTGELTITPTIAFSQQKFILIDPIIVDKDKASSDKVVLLKGVNNGDGIAKEIKTYLLFIIIDMLRNKSIINVKWPIISYTYDGYWWVFQCTFENSSSNFINILYGYDKSASHEDDFTFEFRLYGLDEADVDKFNKSHSNTNILLKPANDKFYKIFSGISEDGDIINPAIELLLKLLPLYDKQPEALTTTPS